MQLCEYTQILSEVQTSNFVIVDRAIITLYPEINSLLKSRTHFVIENGEASKTMFTYEACIEYFIKNHLKRTDSILVIGGGVTTDLGGFVAATILRGVKWIAIPTTLLGMIDASIGGKVGVNSKSGKNLIGNFYEPENILICDHFLKTLPDHEVQSGKGELLKYAFLSDEINNEISENGFSKNIILSCAKFKKYIVDQDIHEKNLRKILNFGHTFGHVFERELGIAHGLAVNLGIEFVVKFFHPNLLDRYNYLAENLGLKPVSFSQIDFELFWDQLLYDKKITSATTIDLVLVNDKATCTVVSWKLDDLKNKLKTSELYENYFH